MGKQTDDVAVLSKQTNPDSIHQIREIIFGEYIKTWEKNFSRLEKKLGDLEKKINSVQVAAENENGNLIEDLSQSKKQLKSEIKKVQNELSTNIKKIDDSKVDKDSIGEVFIQWGQQVKTKK